MLSMQLRKQGGATVITIPPSVLRELHLTVGEALEMNIQDGLLVLKPGPTKKKRTRLTVKQLTQGITPAVAKAMQQETAWAHEGEPVGRELT